MSLWLKITSDCPIPSGLIARQPREAFGWAGVSRRARDVSAVNHSSGAEWGVGALGLRDPIVIQA